MEGIEILSPRDLEYFRKKAEKDPDIKFIQLTEQELLHLDIEKVMKETEEQIIDAESVCEWVRKNKDTLRADYEESQELLKECKKIEQMIGRDGQKTDVENRKEKAEDAIRKMDDDEKRKIVYEAIQAGLDEKEVDMILKMKDTVQMRMLCEMLMKMKR